MKPAADIKPKYPGEVLNESGIFRVRHSIGHYPEIRAYLHAGFCLPDCSRWSCQVTYTKLKAISVEDHDNNNHAAERGGLHLVADKYPRMTDESFFSRVLELADLALKPPKRNRAPRFR